MLHFMVAYTIILVVPGAITLATTTLVASAGASRASLFIIGVAAGAASVTACVGVCAVSFGIVLPTALAQPSGALVMLCMGILLFRPRKKAEKPPRTTLPGSVWLVGAGFLAAISSPLTAMFAAAMFAGPAHTANSSHLVLLAALFVGAANLCWYGTLASMLSRPLARATLLFHERRIREFGAAGLIALALVSLGELGRKLL
ncbi:MAG TPA: hypothetical protein VGN60_04665 [Devosia sp.]|jgi:threonine/homoserine/homoserine lactone efflux protein|nr:hypothetical protein [Devosia sp.]